ncbi:30S ribosomal protein S15 [Candidatus Woesearchaeota archaeon]|nr:30S ribosomal protein S15 [Candidatus Woesearchaeota archaeon]
MARMHSRKKGKAGSKKPLSKTKPSWGRYKEKEIELLVVKLAKEGSTSSHIGMLLRDTYGIPGVKMVSGKSITKILKERKVSSAIPEDLMSLIKKNIAEKRHLETKRTDMTAKRGLQLTESKIRRLVKYYKRTGRLAHTWEYDPDKVRLLIE